MPSDIIPYKMPVANTRPHPKMLAKLGSRRIGGIAALYEQKKTFKQIYVNDKIVNTFN